jgi:hypothetical protein
VALELATASKASLLLSLRALMLKKPDQPLTSRISVS